MRSPQGCEPPNTEAGRIGLVVSGPRPGFKSLSTTYKFCDYRKSLNSLHLSFSICKMEIIYLPCRSGLNDLCVESPWLSSWRVVRAQGVGVIVLRKNIAQHAAEERVWKPTAPTPTFNTPPSPPTAKQVGSLTGKGLGSQRKVGQAGRERRGPGWGGGCSVT